MIVLRSDEENKVTQKQRIHNNNTEEIPAGVSIESASYMENNSDIKIEDQLRKRELTSQKKLERKNKPKTFFR